MNPRPSSSSRSAFTLVEMIGVLAVIAILASLLVPRVFAAMSDARISNAAVACKNIKVAVNEYYGRYTRLGTVGGDTMGLVASGDIYDDWDSRCLVREGLADKPFAVRVGNGVVGGTNGSRIRIINIAGNTGTTRAASDDTTINTGAYNLDGAGSLNDVIGSYVVEACIEAVDNADAVELSLKLDGPQGTADVGESDEAGRVKYLLNPDGTATVRVYVAHK